MSEQGKKLGPDALAALDKKYMPLLRKGSSCMTQKPIHNVLASLENVRQSAENQWMACCPAHEDDRASLAIREDVEGNVLLCCHAGCSADEIRSELGLKWRDLFSGKKPVAFYDYTDGNGELLFQVVRFHPKDFRQRRPDGKGGWIWNVNGIERVLYHLPELIAAPKDQWVYIAEGEADCDRLTKLGLVATTSPMGACKWKDEYNEYFEGRRVVILPDNDEPGLKHAAKIKRSLESIATEIKVVKLPGVPVHGDVTDWLNMGGSKEALIELVNMVNSCKEDIACHPAKSNDHVPISSEPFPVDVLPEPVRSYVVEGAEAIGCDSSFIALPLLSTLAAAIGNAYRIQLKRDWSEPAVLWTVIVGYSGSKKSPALALALEPIQIMQDEALHQYGFEKELYEAEKIEYERCLKRSSKGDPLPEKPDKPEPKRYVCCDTTIEALARLLKTSTRGLLLWRDELAAWFGSFGQYKGGKGNDAAQWLELHRAGCLIVDRKTEGGEPAYIRPASVSVTGGIQPATLKQILGRQYFDNGMAARFLFAMPESKTQSWNEKQINPATKKKVNDLVRKLTELPCEIDENGCVQPVTIPLSQDALAEWVEFYNAHAIEQASLANGDDFAAALSKLEGYAARFALVIHLSRIMAGDSSVNSDAVDVQSIRAGISLERWFRNETKRIYSYWDNNHNRAPEQRLLELVSRKDGTMTVRELMRSGHQYKTAEEADTALQKLVEGGYGVWESSNAGIKGGRPSRRFVLNS